MNWLHNDRAAYTTTNGELHLASGNMDNGSEDEIEVSCFRVSSTTLKMALCAT
ncbi:MAG TPA: hypothetical protein VFX12_03810 [Vicinamibacterales bacterium]|nr:hypothetical protein [Vicinamibacterales bacterium]